MTAIDTALKGARTALNARGIRDPENSPEYTLYRDLLAHKTQTDSEAGVRAALYRRMDNLYYPTSITKGGADRWGDDPNLSLDGKVHVPLNDAAPYVEIPADLQAIIPYINAVPDTSEKKDQEAADRREKLFWLAWDECDMDLNFSLLSRVRSLYGAVALKPYWDKDDKMPGVTVIEAPERLRIGWGSNDFRRMDWALYCYSLSPQAVKEDYDLDVTLTKIDGDSLAVVGYSGGDHTNIFGTTAANQRTRTDYERTQVPVYDYWYKVKGKIWNAIYVGNHQVVNAEHTEYDDIPYIYIPNGRIPGQPDGRPELYDIEHLFHELDERTSNYGQLIYKSLTNPPLQVVGDNDSEYPAKVSADMLPGENRPALPGAGVRIEGIAPFIPTYQIDWYIKHLKDTRTERTGLSDILLGLAGSRVAGSSKAINAELAMYVPRIALQRELLYKGIKEWWEVTGKLWSRKDPDIAEILKDNYRLDVRAPEITVRDDVEQAQRASMLVRERIWSMRRAADATGVDNPSEEQDIIRAEQTDAPLNPGPVTQMMQMLQLAQALGFSKPEQAAQQAGEVSLRDQELAQMGQRQQQAQQQQQRLGGSQSANQPGAAGEAPGALAAGSPPELTSQTMMQNGQLSGRVLSSQKIGGPNGA